MAARIVPPAEAEEVRSAAAPGPSESAALDALLKGQMVHFDDVRSHFNSVRLRQRHGLLLRSRGDGAGGRFYWTEALDPRDQPRRDVR